mmetsp:Transcript_80490/g.130459  ORF Transcript_80490/g.130459 Transcript_80490/m.130459 type:complete len:137 (+) Transcript_80490:608-1018(+)
MGSAFASRPFRNSSQNLVQAFQALRSLLRSFFELLGLLDNSVQYRPVFSGTLVLGLLEFRGLGAGLGDIGGNQVKVSPSGGDNVAVRHLSAQNMLFSGSFFFPFGVPTCETKLQRERESTQRESSTPPAATLEDQR